jgi:glucosamine kinase
MLVLSKGVNFNTTSRSGAKLASWFEAQEKNARMAEILYIGVDGGGTHCRARIRDATGKLLGEGIGGPANARLGASVAMASVVEAAKAALRAAGLDEAAFSRSVAALGMAGAVDDDKRNQLLAQPHPFGRIALDTDGYIAWLGAHGGRDGAILIIGTGSAGLAVVNGNRWNIGGWGHVISDDGSGFEIGAQAVRLAVWAHDGMAPMTELSRALLQRFQNDPAQIVTWADAARPTDFAQFTPLVFEHAQKKDELALPIVMAAAAGIARIAQRLLDVGAPSICLMGGLAEPMRPWLPAAIQARLKAPEADALDGAIFMARRLQPALQGA